MKPDKKYIQKMNSTKQKKKLVVKSISILLEMRSDTKNKSHKSKSAKSRSNNRKI